MVDWVAVTAAVGSISTAGAVVLAWLQLRKGQQQAQTAFEDDLEDQYRQLVAGIHVSALLGAEPEGPLVFLRTRKRISKTTWTSWCGGIRHNFQRPAFKLKPLRRLRPRIG